MKTKSQKIRLVYLILGVILLNAGIVNAATIECDSCESCTNAIKNAPEGSKIVLTKNIAMPERSSCILVENKNNIVFDCNNYSIEDHLVEYYSEEKDYGIGLSNTNHSTIKNCKIINFYAGIDLSNSNNNLIEKNFIDADESGHSYARFNIYLTNSNYNTIRNNNLSSFNVVIEHGGGIYTFRYDTSINSNGNIIEQNTITGPLRLNGDDNKVKENSLSVLYNFKGNNNILENNFISGYAGLFTLKNSILRKNKIYGTLDLMYTNDIIIEGNYLYGHNGISLSGLGGGNKNIKIIGNIIQDGQMGLFLTGTTQEILIEKNIITGNSEGFVTSWDSSWTYDLTMKENIICYNTKSWEMDNQDIDIEGQCYNCKGDDNTCDKIALDTINGKIINYIWNDEGKKGCTFSCEPYNPSPCIDNTAEEQCSSIKPKYCYNGKLIDMCSICGCPSNYYCQLDGSCKLTQRESTTTLSLSKGWNMISSSLSTNLELSTIEQYCSLSICKGYKLWQWNPKINNWEHPTTLSVGRGYYVYASSDCSVPLQGSQYSFDSLTVYKDWNMIAGMNENLDSVKGNCIINDYKGHKVWYWNPRINNWEHPTYLELGKGYYVYVNGDCTLSKSGPPIP